MNATAETLGGGSANLTAILLFVGAYIVGAIPFGVLIAKAQAGVDIMKLGSGNIGATNVHRQLGWKASLPVLLLDICKGLIPTIIARALHLSWPPNLSETDVALLAGFAAVLGHCASPFLKFKGGKGIATICGATIGATPLIAVAGISAFILATLITRYISVGSILAVLAAAVAAWALHYDVWVVTAYGAISLFIIYKHRANIVRLRNGTESKFKFGGNKNSGNTNHQEDVKPKDESKKEEQN